MDEIWPLILLGPRGSGKSSVGRLLAGRLGARFVDLDERIARAAGRSIAEIFADEGEAGFRDRETTALRDVLAEELSQIRAEEARSAAPGREPTAGGSARLILAPGGGIVERAENRRLLVTTGGSRLLLIADPGELRQRTELDSASSASRPPLTGLDPLEEMRQVLARRLPLWREVATHELDTTGLTPVQTCERALSVLVPK